jgi:hypothetical protein
VHALRDPAVRERLEVDADVLDATKQRCADGLPAEFPPAARADALACAADLGVTVDPGFVFDAAIEVRAAAITLLAVAADKSWRARLVANVTSPEAAAAALAALCADDPRRTMADLGAGAPATLKKLSAGADAAAAPHLERCRRALRK